MVAPTVCIGCNKAPHEIEEYVEMALVEGMTPAEFVRSEEGTFNRATGAFCCTDCYVDLGCPSKPAPASWVAGEPT